MAGTIRFDLPPTGFSSGANGDTWNRRYHCEDLDGLTIPDLIAEVYALVPDTGAPAPAPILNMYVLNATIDRIDFEPNAGKAQAWGTIVYTTPTRSERPPSTSGPGTTRTVSASIVSSRTDVDGDGTPIETSYDGATMRHEVEAFSVVSTWTFSRPEDADPENKANLYVGFLNAGLWRGYSDRTVLCAGIDGDSREDAPGVWDVVYTFQFKDDWRVPVVHDDPFFPGHPLPSPDANARKLIQAIPAKDFAGLQIP